jgi:alkylation response protein AidB-like acyl-CoA dehydrogenase
MHQGIPSRTVILDDAGIPADRLIGADGTDFKTALATLNHDRITIAGQALGIAQGALNYAAGYVKERRQFGQAIADFHGVQFMLADTAMKLEAACQLTYHAAAVLGEAMAVAKLPSLMFVSSACKTMDVGHGDVRHHRRGAVAGRLWINVRLPGRADDARRQDHPDAYRIDGARPVGDAGRLCPLVHQGRPASAPPSAPKTAPVQ